MFSPAASTAFGPPVGGGRAHPSSASGHCVLPPRRSLRRPSFASPRIPWTPYTERNRSFSFFVSPASAKVFLLPTPTFPSTTMSTEHSSLLQEKYGYDRVPAAHPGGWRSHAREYFAEFLGTFLLVVLGLGVNNEVSLNGGARGDWLSVNLGWGIGLFLGASASASISGGHLNPAVTLTMAWFGNLPWTKVPGYIVAQTVAAFAAAVVVFVLYYPLYDVIDPTRTVAQGFYATYPADHVPNANAFVTEFFGTAMLLLGIFAITDAKNAPASASSTPVQLMLLLTGLGICFGSNTGYALNPARDFGPRVMTAFFGWGFQVFTLADGYFWIPLVAPCFGGIAGGYVYKFCITNLHPAERYDVL